MTDQKRELKKVMNVIYERQKLLGFDWDCDAGLIIEHIILPIIKEMRQKTLKELREFCQEQLAFAKKNNLTNIPTIEVLAKLAEMEKSEGDLK